MFQKCLVFLVFVTFVIYTEARHGNIAQIKNWEDFKTFHGKMYVNDVHEATHKATFEKNAANVNLHNQAFKLGKVTYQKELNEFADIDPKEFKKRNGLKIPANLNFFNSTTIKTVGALAVTPTSFDWRTKGKVSPVKNQGQCGSCWSFSATGAMESQILIKGKPKQSLAEEQLIECDKNDNGCNGGFYTSAWDYIKSSKGIMSESAYPYSSGNGKVASCKFTSNSKIVQTLTSYKSVGTSDDDIMSAIAHGPLSVAIDASDLQMVTGNTIYSCKKPVLDHAVLVVGYGSTNGKNYWIIKNSWGSSWGQGGYFKLARGTKVDCGMHQYAAYPEI